MWNRREFLRFAPGLATAIAWQGSHPAGNSHSAIAADGAVASSRHFEIDNIQRTTVKLEYRPAPTRAMDRELPHWRYVEVCDVRLKSGITGTGETLLYYTWGAPTDKDVQYALGKNAVDLLWDDNLGAGLQMALFDAVGRTAEVPVHALLGRKVHQTTPLSWWNIDTSAVDMAAECRLAHEQGYMSYKTKGRPWFDIDEQLRQATQVVPKEFRIDMDFNGTLLTAEQGLPILKRLEKHPQVDIYESPIPQEDVPGNAAICAATRVNVAMHYGKPRPATVVRSKCCDGFVVGGGASRVTGAARFCEQVELPFWLQLVGAGLTAAYSLHFGGVSQQAVWPAVNCHQLFEDDMLTRKITVKNGSATVPDHPGIGYEVDREFLEKHKVAKPKSRPEPQRLIETRWPDGRRIYTANNGKVNFMLTAANAGKYPYYAAGADTRLVPDDGSDRWRKLYQTARTHGPTSSTSID